MANGHGGKRPNSGRKTKAEQLGLLDLMDSIKPSKEVLEQLKLSVEDGNLKAIELWLAYAYGKPRETVNQTTNQRITIEDNTENGLP